MMLQIIRQIRAVKGGVKEIGGDLERDGNPTLKNQRLVVGSRPYMLIPQRPGEYRDDQLRAIEKKRQRIQEEEKLRYESVVSHTFPVYLPSSNMPLYYYIC